MHRGAEHVSREIGDRTDHRRSPRSPHANVVVAASRAMFAITANAAYKSLFYEAGAGPLLMTALLTHVTVSKAVVAICGALYSLANQRGADQDRLDTGLPRTLVSALTVHAAHASTVKAVFSLLVEMYTSGDFDSACRAAGVFPRIIDALQTHLSHEGVVAAACSYLSDHFVEDDSEDSVDQNALAFISDGGLEPILAALTAYSSNRNIVRELCMVLDQICYNSPASRPRIVAALPEIVRPATLHFLACSDTADYVCQVLLYVCTPANEIAFLEAGAIAFACMALGHYHRFPRLVYSVCEILRICGCVESTAEVFRSGGVLALITSLGTSENCTTVASAARVLRRHHNLIYDAMYERVFVDAIPRMVSILAEHLDKSAVVDSLCDLLDALSYKKIAAATAIVAGGAIATMAAALSTHATKPKLCSAVLSLLSNLLTHCAASPAVRESVSTFVPCCTAALELHVTHANLAGFACRVLELISGLGAQQRAHVADSGALRHAGRVVTAHAQDDWTLTKACRLMWAVGDDDSDDGAHVGTGRGIVAALTQHAEVSDFVEAASLALRMLCGRMSNIPELLAAGAAEALRIVAECHVDAPPTACAVRATLAALSKGVCAAESCIRLTTKQCVRCLAVGYCSRACQRAHAEAHLAGCRDVGMPEEADEGSVGGACVGAGGSATDDYATGSSDSVSPAATAALARPSPIIAAAAAVAADGDSPDAVSCASPGCDRHPALFQCGRCLSVRYCSAACQGAHYRSHRKACRVAAAAAASASTPRATESLSSRLGDEA